MYHITMYLSTFGFKYMICIWYIKLEKHITVHSASISAMTPRGRWTLWIDGLCSRDYWTVYLVIMNTIKCWSAASIHECRISVRCTFLLLFVLSRWCHFVNLHTMPMESQSTFCSVPQRRNCTCTRLKSSYSHASATYTPAEAQTYNRIVIIAYHIQLN